MEEKKYCNQCENHCPIDDLKCGKGRRAFGLEQGENGNGQNHEHGHGHGHEHGHGAHCHHKKMEGVLGLLQSCGYALHHGEIGEDGLNCLSKEEKEQLEKLLTKLLSNWHK